MTHTGIVIALLAFIAVMLFLCWIALKNILLAFDSLVSFIRGFIHDYEVLNDYGDRKKSRLEVLADREAIEWHEKHPEGQ